MSKIHVVSPGRNPSKAILNCVESVQRQTLQPESHTLIDDISDDDTPDVKGAADSKKTTHVAAITTCKSYITSNS